jgi:hypothetical protein
MNGMLITIKAEETISMIKNVVVPFIKAEHCRDKNIHTFEIMNAQWVSKGTMLIRMKIVEVTMMDVNSFKKHKIPFQFDLETRMLEQGNLMKIKCVDWRFELGYKPKKDKCKRVTKIKKNRKLE